MSAGAVVLVGYYSCLGSLALFGLHRLLLVALARRAHRRPPESTEAPASWPVVTVQLPIYNERHVAGRLIDAVAALDYPIDRLEIQVLDDSDDGTSEGVGRSVDRWRRQGRDIHHLRRSRRVGFKAGALAAGLRRARGRLIAVFDADFVPPADFLRRTVPCFAAADVGMVQVRWDHLNRDHSMLTRIQALFLDAHFAVEHAARAGCGWFFNFNGTAGVWRREAIVDAGGWQHDTLTEDLDLSYRAQLAGWRFAYLHDVAVPAELPATIAAFQGQQRRWTRGSIQTARKLLGPLWRSQARVRVKLEATAHLLGNLAYPLMVSLGAFAVPAMLARLRWGGGLLPWLDALILAAGTGSFAVFFAFGQRAVGRSWVEAIVTLPALMTLGAGIAVNNSWAVVQGVSRPVGEFVRTPKYAVVGRASELPAGDDAAAPGPLAWLEAALAMYFATAVVGAVVLGSWASLPILCLFLGGTAYVFALSAGLGRRGARS